MNRSQREELRLEIGGADVRGREDPKGPVTPALAFLKRVVWVLPCGLDANALWAIPRALNIQPARQDQHQIKNTNMHNTSVVLNTGNFSLHVSGILSDEAVAEMLDKGLKYEVQRDVASKVYTAIAGVPNKKGTGKSLPEGFERDSIPFAPETAELFRKTALDVLGEKGEFEVTVTEYTGAEGEQSMKGAERYVATMKSTAETEKGMRQMFGIMGLADGLAADWAETATTQELVSFAHSKGLAVRK